MLSFKKFETMKINVLANCQICPDFTQIRQILDPQNIGIETPWISKSVLRLNFGIPEFDIGIGSPNSLVGEYFDVWHYVHNSKSLDLYSNGRFISKTEISKCKWGDRWENARIISFHLVKVKPTFARVWNFSVTQILRETNFSLWNCQNPQNQFDVKDEWIRTAMDRSYLPSLNKY